METNENEEMAVVMVCDNYVQAEIVQGNLISQGIHAEIYDNGMASIMLNEGVPVIVPKGEYESAMKILDEKD